MKNVHFIGIEGIGMSGLANIMLSAGLHVSGSDLNPGEQCRRLCRRGATIYREHAKSNLGENIDSVIATEAIAQDNPELSSAHARNIPVWKYAAMLGLMMKSRVGLGIAGTHGKSTTSGLLAYILDQAGLEPSFVVGARVPQLGGNAAWGKGSYFVAESCEYARSFLNLHPQMAIITNIEADHLDYYHDLNEIVEAFEEFAGKLPESGFLVIEEQAHRRFLREPRCTVETYSIHDKADWQITELENGDGHAFQVIYQGRRMGRFETKLPGLHNVSNTLSAIALAFQLGISYSCLFSAVKSYRGVERRFQTRLECPVTIVDDYAHHPTEIKAVLQAARERFAKERIWCVFQPHQASRTYRMLGEFARSFDSADEVIVTDIFFARDSREVMSKISARDLVDAIGVQGKSAYYLPNLSSVADFLPEKWREGDVILTLGAGDIYKLATILCNCATETSCLASILK